MKKPIQIRVDDSDLEDWTRKAGEADLSLSEWIRRKCNRESIVSDAVLRDVRETTKRHIQQQVLAERGVPEPGYWDKCPHHKMRGELCYKCDPKFGMPQVEG